MNECIRIVRLPEQFFYATKSEIGFLPVFERRQFQKYTAADLEEFRKRIVIMLRQTLNDYVLLRRILKRHYTANTQPTFKFWVDDEDVYTRDEIKSEADRLEVFIEQLGLALLRIENGTYGICCFTGKLIPKKVLFKMPTASFIAIRENDPIMLN